MPTSPQDLRALAARCTGETTDELRDAIQDAIGTSRWTFDDNGRAYRRHTPNPLTDLNASAAAMPAGWLVDVVIDADWTLVTTRRTSIAGIEQAEAPTERHARTAAALMAMATELEQKERET